MLSYLKHCRAHTRNRFIFSYRYKIKHIFMSDV